MRSRNKPLSAGEIEPPKPALITINNIATCNLRSAAKGYESDTHTLYPKRVAEPNGVHHYLDPPCNELHYEDKWTVRTEAGT